MCKSLFRIHDTCAHKTHTCYRPGQQIRTRFVALPPSSGKWNDGCARDAFMETSRETDDLVGNNDKLTTRQIFRRVQRPNHDGYNRVWTPVHGACTRDQVRGNTLHTFSMRRVLELILAPSKCRDTKIIGDCENSLSVWTHLFVVIILCFYSVSYKVISICVLY